MRKALGYTIAFLIGVGCGTLGTIGYNAFQSDLQAECDKAVQEQMMPVMNMSSTAGMFCALKGRAPRDLDELATYAAKNNVHDFDPSLFVSIECMQLSETNAVIVWHGKEPLSRSGTNPISWTKQ